MKIEVWLVDIGCTSGGYWVVSKAHRSVRDALDCGFVKAREV